GRMPHMLLNPKEAADLANFLCFGKGPRKVHELPKEPRADRPWVELGKRLVAERGCINCHTVAPGGKPLTGAAARAWVEEIKAPKRHPGGCLAADGRGRAPQFSLAEADRAALRHFLKEGSAGAGSPSPAHAASVTLQRFNCLACHTRAGEGGLAPDLV